MRIGIDATCWANDRGYGRFTRELVGAMPALAPADEFVCFLDRRAAARGALSAPIVRPVIVPQRVAPTVAAASGRSRSLPDMLRLTSAVSRARLDAFLSPSVYGFFPLPPGLPAVVAVHDAIAERFPSLTLPTGRDRLFWRLKVRLALRQASLVLTVSEYARDEIVRHLGVNPADVRVTLEGVSAEYRPSESPEAVAAAAARVGVPSGARWLMYVGGFNPHKRVDLLARAHAVVARRHPTPPLALVLAGPQDDGFHQDLARIRSAIAEGGAGDLVRWPGYLDDATLRHLHSGALALVLPSESEGFGLPAVEAASCGAPVIATTASPLPQILERGGIFVPPGDFNALERAIERVVTRGDERRTMSAHALERARRLSWPSSAQVALEALRYVAGQSSARRRRAAWARRSRRVSVRRTGAGIS
jgi:glycosyltransferase involved in cell wall biosynthesis